MRYDQLLTLIDEHKPRVIVEVGVARAERACAMIERALLYRSNVQYVGYDVFETKDAAFHVAAFNMKKVDSQAACAAKLTAIQQRHKGFQFSLVVGDTRDTLHGKHIAADLAFIDGDHRVDAIRKDYEALQDSGVVVLDDYYTADARGCPDIDVVGCNRLVEELNGGFPPPPPRPEPSRLLASGKYSTSVLPPQQPKITLSGLADQVRDGGLVQMVVIRH